MYKQFNNVDGSVCDTAIIRATDNACIPFDEANTDYQAYLKWVEEGNLPYPSDYVEPSPTASVTPLSAENE